MPGFRKHLLLLACFTTQVWAPVAIGQEATDVQLSFGRVELEQEIQQVIHFGNPTSNPLKVSEIQLTPPLLAKQISKIIPSGGSGQFTLVLGKDREYGHYEGLVKINFVGNTIDPIVFSVEGFVIPPIEFKPYAAFFVATHAGKQKSAFIDVINHREEPLVLTDVESTSERFAAILETVAHGQHYRLKLVLDGNARPGEKSETIELVADPPTQNPLIIKANTIIRESVYTFPESVNFGAIPFKTASDRDQSKLLSQTLMVYRPDTRDFEVEARIDLDYIELESEPGPEGDRYQLTLTLIPEKVAPGKIEGVITITTNDSEYDNLEVQLGGNILE